MFGEKYKFFTKEKNREQLSRLITVKYKNPLSVLSMGMSSDYELAIKHGSNMVRIGSSFLGNS